MIANEVVDRRSEAEAVLDGGLAADEIALCLREGVWISLGHSGGWLGLHFSELIFLQSVASDGLALL